jgi:hypothetical protein
MNKCFFCIIFFLLCVCKLLKKSISQDSEKEGINNKMKREPVTEFVSTAGQNIQGVMFGYCV